MSTIPQLIQIGQHKKDLHPAEVLENLHLGKKLEKLKVYFCNMPLRETATPNIFPLGPALMAKRLRNEFGVDVRIIDLNAHRVKDALSQTLGLTNGRHLTRQEAIDYIARHFQKYGEPDVFGLSGMITTLAWQEDIVTAVRQMCRDTFIVSGGGLATDLRDDLFTAGWMDGVDAIACSEGDDTMPIIVHYAQVIKSMGIESAINSGKLSQYYYGYLNDRHRFIFEGDRPKHLDDISIPDFSFFDADVDGNPITQWYLNAPVWSKQANNSSAADFCPFCSTSSVATRGCPHQCNYCDRTANGERDWRYRTAENLAIEYALHYGKYGIDFHAWTDDNFMIRRDVIMRLPEVFRNLFYAGVQVRWGTHGRLDEIADMLPERDRAGSKLGSSYFHSPLRVKAMADAGCIYIGAGAESTSPKVLTSMEKGGQMLANGMLNDITVNGITYKFNYPQPATMVWGIIQGLEHGVHVNCTWIMGYMDEELIDLKQTVDFMRWQKRIYSDYGKAEASVNTRMFMATPYPGTAMMKNAKVQSILGERFGLIINPSTGRIAPTPEAHQFYKQLDDATKLISNDSGLPLNFSNIPDDVVYQAREYVDNGQTERISDM